MTSRFVTLIPEEARHAFFLRRPPRPNQPHLPTLTYTQLRTQTMADAMDVDAAPAAVAAPAKAKAKEDGKEGKKRFEVKKVRSRLCDL